MLDIFGNDDSYYSKLGRYRTADPNENDGNESASYNYINPKTGLPDPSYRPPSDGTPDSLGQSTTNRPGGSTASGGGGAGSGFGGFDSGASTGAGVAANTAGILGSSLKWGDLINAALAIYGLNQSGKTPNFYSAPLTPSEQYRLDQTKNLYNFGSSYTEQYLKGLGNLNPDFKMPNSLTGNPAFMGGVKVPTIDFSKVPSINGAPPPSGQTAQTPSDPSAIVPPTITPDRVHVNQTTGQWFIDNPTPQEQAWVDQVNTSKSGAAPQASGGSQTAP